MHPSQHSSRADAASALLALPPLLFSRLASPLGLSSSPLSSHFLCTHLTSPLSPPLPSPFPSPLPSSLLFTLLSPLPSYPLLSPSALFSVASNNRLRLGHDPPASRDSRAGCVWQVMVVGGKVHVVRARQLVDDIWKNETPLPADATA